MPAEPLSRPRILAAAVALIEREGADAVSMRGIAAELGVGVMSLYNHVPNKSALLDGVAETVLSQVEFADDPDADWSARVRTQALAFRQIAHHYPRCTMVVVSRQLRSTAGLLPVERALATLRGAGFGGRDAVRVLRVFIAYIVGSLLREVGVTPTFAPVDRPDIAIERVDSPLFPQTGAPSAEPAGCDQEAEFAFGLDLLIQATAVRLEHLKG